MSEVKKFNADVSVEMLQQLNDLKKNLNLSNNSKLIELLLSEYIYLDDDLKSKIVKLSHAKGLSEKDLLIGFIKKAVVKESKDFGITKGIHKKTAQAESELLDILQQAVNYYDNMTDATRKIYLSPSAVNKFILMKDLKQKNMAVIKRFLATEQTNFVREYHERNNLKPKKAGYNAR